MKLVFALTLVLVPVWGASAEAAHTGEAKSHSSASKSMHDMQMTPARNRRG